jgi:inosine-uridine nucleoside N-ribohydrolase
MAFMLEAWHPDIELIGVTSVFGNATLDTTTRDARYLAGQFAPGVPVAKGAPRVCQERGHQSVDACDALPKMREGPSESACRSRFQTATSCEGKEPSW